jgi:phenylacetate-coenzyme A ligase PaaK-like adenylate-forming protein
MRARLDAAARLRQLVEHASAHSPHYRRTLAGLEGAPLGEWPVLTKEELVERFDELVTDNRLRRADVEAFVRSAAPGELLLGRYHVAASSGSTGRPSLVVFDQREWAGLLASSASARRLSGSTGGRSVKIGSPSPWHLSSQLGATLRDPRRPTLRLPVTTPIEELTAALDAAAPAVLSASPSMLAVLAAEQQADRLHVSPGQVFTSGEVLTTATRRRAAATWGVEPFDQYVTTETATIAAECTAHAGLHVLDDHVVVEVVDDEHRPVPDGRFGTAVLVTVLSSRTVPLVRYKLADSACMTNEPCSCGRDGPRLVAIAGRERDVLRFGQVAVHPSAFTAVLDVAPVAAWQVEQAGDRVRVLVTGAQAPFDAAAVQHELLNSLTALGATSASVEVAEVDSIPRDEGGKASLFVRR